MRVGFYVDGVCGRVLLLEVCFLCPFVSLLRLWEDGGSSVVVLSVCFVISLAC